MSEGLKYRIKEQYGVFTIEVEYSYYKTIGSQFWRKKLELVTEWKTIDEFGQPCEYYGYPLYRSTAIKDFKTLLEAQDFLNMTTKPVEYYYLK
jgi:hypothetical protein